ncbi:hypothetical protein GY45DRAFT_1029069 [Cubamyces sp. BRFM 1775]|nr:hypothetical protein GY45DRAFT_1029069 [Cubamyces sp. BRFM 1775]
MSEPGSSSSHRYTKPSVHSRGSTVVQPPSGSAFPTELYEEIIQEIGPNRIMLPLAEEGELDRRTRLSTLCACALTCRAWLPTSRTYLYRQLTFIGTDKVALELLVRSLEANPWLRTLVHDLNVIDNDEEYTPGIVPPSTSSAWDISRTWALILAGKLPCLRDIGLALARGLTCHPQFVRSLHAFTAVTSLSLAWKGSGTFQDLLKLLTAFSGLRRLLVYGAAWAPRGAKKLVLPRRRFPPLAVLTVESDGENVSSLQAFGSALAYNTRGSLSSGNGCHMASSRRQRPRSRCCSSKKLASLMTRLTKPS